MPWKVTTDAIRNPHKVGRFRDRLKSKAGRVHVVGIGNSNQMFEGYGHDYGVAFGLDTIHGAGGPNSWSTSQWGCYTTGAIGPGSPNNERLGYGWYVFGLPGTQSFSSAPTSWLPWVDNIPANGSKWLGAHHPWYRLSAGSGPSASGPLIAGGTLGELPVQSPINVNAALRVRFYSVKDSVNGPASAVVNVRKAFGLAERVQVTIDRATGGTFTLTFSGNTTSPLAFNASDATVLAALQALPGIGAGNVTVAKNTFPSLLHVYTIEFAGTLGAANVADLTASGAGLTGPGASIQVSIEQGNNGFVTELAVATITNAGAAATPQLVEDTLAVPANARNYSIQVAVEKQGASISAHWLPHTIAIDRPEVAAGWGYTTLVYLGGQGLRVFVERLRAVSMEHKLAVFSNIRRSFLIDGQQPCILIDVEEGVNSRNDLTPSVGPSPAPSNTEEGYYDNLMALWTELRLVWQAGNWPQSEWEMMVDVSAITELADGDLARFRRASARFSDAVSNAAFCDKTRLIENFAEAQTFMASGGADPVHLNIRGYEQYGLRKLQCLAATSGTETLRDDLRRREPDRRTHRGAA